MLTLRGLQERSSIESMGPGDIWDALGSWKQVAESLGGPHKDCEGSQPQASAGNREEAVAIPEGVRRPTWPSDEVVAASFSLHLLHGRFRAGGSLPCIRAQPSDFISTEGQYICPLSAGGEDSNT